MKQEFQNLVQSLIDSCPQEGYIPLEEYAFQESVKAYLLDLCNLQLEDVEAFLSKTSLLETLKKLLGEHLLHFSPSTLLWLAEIERGLGMFREILGRNQQTSPLS